MVLYVARNGNEVRTTYNVDGNPVLEIGTDRNGKNHVTRSWEYDASGNVRKAVAGGFCYTYEYRPDGKLLKKSASGRTILSCSYHADGSLESLTDASGKPVFYEYDWRGNLSGVRDEDGNMLAAYAHMAGGKLKEIRHGNGIRTGYEYDTDGNLVHLHMERTDGEILADLYYSHDLNGNRTLKSGSRIDGEGEATEHKVSYVYDRMDRLVSETYQGEETSYMYDLCGNRLKKLDKNGTEEYHYNRKNQLICRFSEKEKTAYRYDLQGNLLEAAGAEGTAVFSYNAFQQQTAVIMPDGKHLENRYDVEYLRAGMVENGTVTTFSYHNGELLAESSPDGDTISRYIPGYGVAAGWNRERSGYHYYHLDEQNSTAYITGSSGEIENRYEYDAFGVLQDSREELPNRILYTGQQYDQTSGQYYLRARFYNPVLGRFVQEDVYRGDGLNLYAYCKNNPVVYYDPSGYDSQYLCKEEASAGGNAERVYSGDMMSPDDATRYSEYWRGLGIGSDETYKEFLRANPNSNIDDYFRLVNEQSPWPDNYNPFDYILEMKGGDTFSMVLDSKQPVTSPGGFGILGEVPSVDFARNDMAIKVDWKEDCGKVATFKIKDGVNLHVPSGSIGPQIDLTANKYLPGNNNATQLDLFNGLGRIDRNQYIEYVPGSMKRLD